MVARAEPKMRDINLNYYKVANSTPFPSKLAVLLLASSIGIPAIGQQPAATAQSTPPSTTASPANPADAKEGFWGRVNPFARKVWVKKRIDPINDRLTELDALNAK